MLNMLLVGPFLSIEEEQAHVLPVDSVCLSCFRVSDGWHLEGEQGASLHHLLLVFFFAKADGLPAILVKVDDVVV